MNQFAIAEGVLSDGSYQMTVSRGEISKTMIVSGIELLALCNANPAGWPDVRCRVYDHLVEDIKDKEKKGAVGKH